MNRPHLFTTPSNASARTILRALALILLLTASSDALAQITVDEDFDPNHMEAMFRVPTDSEDQDDKVQDVLQKGYSLNGHLIRPARVSVFKHE